MKLTKRGTFLVAISKIVVALTVGYFLVGAIGSAMDYETEKAARTGAAYSAQLEAKKAIR